MVWEFQSDIPIYKQIMDILIKRICNGTYPLGGSVPSVRELAEELGVNPNTVQRAFASLEGVRIVMTHRTAGRRITTDPAPVNELRVSRARGILKDGIREVEEFGLTKEEILKIFKEEYEGL